MTMNIQNNIFYAGLGGETNEVRYVSGVEQQVREDLSLSNPMRAFGAEISNQSQETASDTLNASSKTVDSHLNPKLLGLQHNEIAIKYPCTAGGLRLREILLKWLITEGQVCLELKNYTIQHCIRLFDLYCHCCGGIKPDFCEAKLDMLGCLHISSKYHEIYAPMVSDFEYVSKFKYTIAEILEREMQILLKVQFRLVIPLASEWHFVLFGTEVPSWINLLFPSLSPFASMRRLAEAIHEQFGNRQLNKDEDKQITGSIIPRILNHMR